MAPGIAQSNLLSWNKLLARYVKARDYQKTLELFQQMRREGMNPDSFTFSSVLKACSSLRALEEGRRIHTQVIESGYESDVFLGNRLLDMYVKCGRIDDAFQVFNKIPTRNVFSWTVLIGGYVKGREGQKALELYRQMHDEGVEPDPFTYVAVLNACANVAALGEGRRVHKQITEKGFESDGYVGNSLVDMYAKCGSVDDAWSVFVKMPGRDVVSWNAMILGYARCGQGQKALDLYQQMLEENLQPDPTTFVGVLNACARLGAVEHGRRVHKHIIQTSYESDVYVGGSLVDMYTKCGSMEDAWGVFSKISKPDVVPWTSMITGYAKRGQGRKALELFRQMQCDRVEPNAVTFVGALSACASIAAVAEGKHLHEQIIRKGYDSQASIASSLIDMYAKCGSIEDACQVFTEMPVHDVVAWNAMILGYVKCKEGRKALQLFGQMQRDGVEPNAVTFVGVLTACANVGALEEGRRVHEQIIERGHASDLYVASCLVDMYAKCESIEDAWKTFNQMRKRDVVAWSAMIFGYVKSGQGQKALELFREMQRDGVEPTPVTFVGVLNACASRGALEEGRCVHDEIIQRGYELDVFVASGLIDMYVKCRTIEDAWRVFIKMPTRTTVSWNSMILGYVKNGEGPKALELYQQMQDEGFVAKAATFVGVLNACASIAALEEGRRVHQHIIQNNCEADVFVSNSLIDMYAKSGSIEDAWTIFGKMPTRNVVTWSAMILAYVKDGEGQKALDLYRDMEREGVVPDSGTFVGVLDACASVEALEEGRRVHEQIIHREYETDGFLGSCLVNMYAKCGSISDAETIFREMSTRDSVSWNAMLAGYARHGHAEQALEHFKQMCEEEIDIDKLTLVSLLSACSHAGLVTEGLHYFESVTSVHGITPGMEHYTCVIDLLARAGRLHEAEDLMQSVSDEPSASMWMSLLGACRVHGNVEIAERVAKRVRESDPESAAGYVLLSNIYADAGDWKRSSTVHLERFLGAQQRPLE